MSPDAFADDQFCFVPLVLSGEELSILRDAKYVRCTCEGGPHYGDFVFIQISVSENKLIIHCASRSSDIKPVGREIFEPWVGPGEVEYGLYRLRRDTIEKVRLGGKRPYVEEIVSNTGSVVKVQW